MKSKKENPQNWNYLLKLSIELCQNKVVSIFVLVSSAEGSFNTIE